MTRRGAMTFWAVLAVIVMGLPGCGKKVDADKTLKCAEKQPYKSEADCKACCGGDFKLSDDVCLCYQ